VLSPTKNAVVVLLPTKRLILYNALPDFSPLLVLSPTKNALVVLLPTKRLILYNALPDFSPLLVLSTTKNSFLCCGQRNALSAIVR
jgi:hypothetical protein